MSSHHQTKLNGQSTARDVIAGHDMSGVTAIITGGSSGLGAETARALVSAGADVVLAVRNVTAAEPLLKELNAVRRDIARAASLDLSDFSSIRAFALYWGKRPLKLLVNNAGVMAGSLSYTTDGLEMNIGVNHFGHFLLTLLLVPALELGGASRVIQLTSGGHRFWPIDFNDMHFRSQPYSMPAAYGRSKTANILFTVGFQRRFGERGIMANAVIPGYIHTGLMRQLSPEQSEDLSRRLVNHPVKTPAQGAATSVWAAVDNGLVTVGGRCLEDCAIVEIAREGHPGGVMPHAVDPATADRLWALSVETTGTGGG